MKKKLLALIVPFMMVGALTGCESSKQYDEFCAKAADTMPMLLNSATGKEIYASEEHVRDLEDYNSVLALGSFKYQEKELTVNWELLPAEKWVKSSYALDETRYKITPVYGKEDFEASIKCTVSYVEGKKTKGKTEMNWKFNVAKTEVVEMTLKELNEAFVANDNKLPNSMTVDEEGKTVQIGTRGYITATYEQPDHTYSGVFISDGEYSLQLYAGQISNLWKENGLKVGDCIFAVGPLSMYGIIEMKPTMMEPIDGEAYKIAEPKYPDLTNNEAAIANDDKLWIHQSSLVTMTGAKYKSGLDDFKPKSHSTLVFTCQEKDVKLYCSYHLGETMMTAIQTAINAYKDNPPAVTIKGILTYSTTDPASFQIIPVFGTDSIKAAA